MGGFGQRSRSSRSGFLLRARPRWRHTYIQLPAGAAASDAPAFLARTDSGEEAILNYRVNGPWIIVDGLFERAELVAGVGRSRRTVKISNRSFDRAAGSR